MRDENPCPLQDQPLPDLYATVAEDVLSWCGTPGCVCVDLGAGAGGLGLALAARTSAAIVLVDPNSEALSRGLLTARQQGIGHRVVAVVGSAEDIPLPEGSCDAVVSRGSFYFWQDRAQGLREVYRILAPGGKAMIGGGLGSSYPEWARREFIRRQWENLTKQGDEALRRFREARSRETFQRLADEAGLPSFEVVGRAALPPTDPCSGVGIWLRFAKEE